MSATMLREVRLKSCPRCKTGDLAQKEYVRKFGNLATVEEEWVCLQCGYHEEAK